MFQGPRLSASGLACNRNGVVNTRGVSNATPGAHQTNTIHCCSGKLFSLSVRVGVSRNSHLRLSDRESSLYSSHNVKGLKQLLVLVSGGPEIFREAFERRPPHLLRPPFFATFIPQTRRPSGQLPTSSVTAWRSRHAALACGPATLGAIAVGGGQRKIYPLPDVGAL